MAVEKEKLIDMYKTMVRVRTFEDRVCKEFAAGNIPGFVHLYAGEVKLPIRSQHQLILAPLQRLPYLFKSFAFSSCFSYIRI